MGTCEVVAKSLQRYANSKLRGPSEAKVSTGERFELGVFLGYIAVQGRFYNFFYSGQFQSVLRLKSSRALSGKKFLKLIKAQVISGVMSVYPSVGTIIPRMPRGRSWGVRLQSAEFNSRLPLYIDHGLLKPLLCSAVVPQTGLTTGAAVSQRGRVDRLPLALVAVRPQSAWFKGFDVILKAGAITLEAEAGYALGEWKRGHCAVLAVDLSTCSKQRKVFAISFSACDNFSHAPLCVIWGFRRVGARDVGEHVERLLSAGAEPNSLVPVADKECLSRATGSTRKRLLECTRRVEGDAVLPTEDYVKACGIDRRTVEVLNSPSTKLGECPVTHR